MIGARILADLCDGVNTAHRARHINSLRVGQSVEPRMGLRPCKCDLNLKSLKRDTKLRRGGVGDGACAWIHEVSALRPAYGNELSLPLSLKHGQPQDSRNAQLIRIFMATSWRKGSI